jgi:hypothetical protein
MWVVQHLPEFVIHAIFAAGVIGVIVGFVLDFVPTVRLYKFAIQVISIIVLSLGIYIEGGLADTRIWKQRIAELEIKYKDAEIRAAKKNVEIQEVIVERVKVVKEKSAPIVKYVTKYQDREVLKFIEGPERVRVEEVIRYVENCPVPREFIDAHNQAATLTVAGEGDKK